MRYLVLVVCTNAAFVSDKLFTTSVRISILQELEILTGQQSMSKKLNCGCLLAQFNAQYIWSPGDNQKKHAQCPGYKRLFLAIAIEYGCFRFQRMVYGDHEKLLQTFMFCWTFCFFCAFCCNISPNLDFAAVLWFYFWFWIHDIIYSPPLTPSAL